MIKFKYLFIRKYKSDKLQIRPHVHDCYEFVYYYKGQGNGRYLQINDVPVFPSDMNICYINNQDMLKATSFRFSDNSYAVFSPYTVHDEQHEKQADLITVGFYHDDSEPIITNTAHCDNDLMILHFIKQIQDEYFNKYTNYENMICSIMTQLLTHLYRKENKQINNNDEIARIKNYMDEYYASDISVSHLAELAHYSDDHFCLKFKNAYKVSPKTYIIDKRMELARYLLSSTTLSLQEIALQCGYDDYTQFSQIFKAKVGISPKKYQSSLMK